MALRGVRHGDAVSRCEPVASAGRHGGGMNHSTTLPRAMALDTDLLERFRSRAGELDRTNSYFYEDLEELRELGYLAAAVPVHHGGGGLDLAELAQSQRRMARFAPATALATTMHFYWTAAQPSGFACRAGAGTREASSTDGRPPGVSHT